MLAVVRPRSDQCQWERIGRVVLFCEGTRRINRSEEPRARRGKGKHRGINIDSTLSEVRMTATFASELQNDAIATVED